MTHHVAQERVEYDNGDFIYGFCSVFHCFCNGFDLLKEEIK